jgi:hypothetical protein
MKHVEIQSFNIPDVDVYGARNDYWSGQILRTVSGASLYQTNRTDRPWGIRIHCNAQGHPHSVEFENGTLWSFCALNDRILKTEWPILVKDLSTGIFRARAGRFFTDSMHLSIVSGNALLNDILIWKYPPRGGRNGLHQDGVSAERLLSCVLRIQRTVRAFFIKRLEARFTALAMGLHHRLGVHSALNCLYSEILHKVIRQPRNLLKSCMQ